MIGIALERKNSWIVGEFFQLFKTPWDWLAAGKHFDVVITDNAQAQYPDARLVIVMHRPGAGAGVQASDSLVEPVWLEHGAIAFPLYHRPTAIGDGQAIIRARDSGACAGSYRADNGQRIIQLGYDFFAEAEVLLTSGQPVSCAATPTLDRHIDNLRHWILAAGIALTEIPPVPANGHFFACLTHDVDFAGIRHHKFDRTAAGFVYRALFKSVGHYFRGEYTLAMLWRNWLAVAKLPLVYLGLCADPWHTFRHYRDIEGDAPSTFYFVPFQGVAGHAQNGPAPAIRAVKYSAATLGDDIQALIADGCEIGVHGIDSWTDSGLGEQEIAQLRELTGEANPGVRMHWLYFDAESPGKLEQSGYAYDSTGGYNETVGYRAGTCQVFRPQGAQRLLALPLHIMDSALFYPDRLNLSLSEGAQKISALIAQAAAGGGVLTFNWHDRSIAPERLWDGVYREALSELRASGACFATAGEVVRWFGKRRSVVFDSGSTAAAGTTTGVSCAGISPADGMVLRRYAAAEGGQTPASGSTPSFRDSLLADYSGP